MFTPSADIVQLLRSFSSCFSAPAFSKVVTLICGVILSPGRRTVASALRAVGLGSDRAFCNYHRLLSRDRWSCVLLSKYLLFLLLETFIPPDMSIDIVADETLERRRGKKIVDKGWFRDPVRSTHSNVVTTPAIRWLNLSVLVPVPWSSRRWAMPFFTIPVRSKKNCAKQRRMYRGTVGLTIDALIKVRHWIGVRRQIRFIADGGFTKMELLEFNKALDIAQIGRLRLDAALYDEPEERPASTRGPKPKKGTRLPNLKQRLSDPSTVWRTVEMALYGGTSKTMQIAEGIALWHVAKADPARLRWVLVRFVNEDGKVSQSGAAFFSSDLDMSAEKIVGLYAERWNIEVLFEEIRACLGFETQRGWSKSTIGRTTPCLFGIFSLVVRLAKRLFPETLPIRQSAWYSKEEATFRDVIGAVREHLWTSSCLTKVIQNPQNNITTSPIDNDYCLIPASFLAALREVAYYAD